jgi:hypothetical protein
MLMKRVSVFLCLTLLLSLLAFFPSPKAFVDDWIKVGVFYYPWYKEGFGNYHWNGTPPSPLPSTWWTVVDKPVLGWYDSSNRTVIDQHLNWFRDAGIDFGILSWWGPDSYEDNCTKVLFDETSSYAPWFRWVISIEDCYNVTNQSLSYLATLRDYVYSNYASVYHAIWLNETSSGKPYLFWMNAHDLENDTVRNEAKSDSRFVTRILGQADYSDWKTWTPYTYGNTTSAFPPSSEGFMCVMPRYDETRLDPNGTMGKVRDRCADPFLNGSDGQNVDPLNGEPLYDEQWQEVLSNASAGKVKYVAIATWNDFTERTQIEPCYDNTSAYKDYPSFLLDKTWYYTSQLRLISLQGKIDSLNNQINDMLHAEYALAAATVILAVATVYLRIRKPETKQGTKETRTPKKA